MADITEQELFQRFFTGGFFSTPLLIKFSRTGGDDILLTNDNDNIVFDGNVYKASSFEYTPADELGKGVSLRVSGIGNGLVEFIENADDTFRLDVVATISEKGTIQPLRYAHYFMGKVSWGDSMELNFELGSDDRLEMTFPPYQFDSDTNRGNT